MNTKPVSVTLFPWLKANLGKTCLAPLTGTDRRALLAAVHIVCLYSQEPDDTVAQAFGRVVSMMQVKCRHLAYHAVAHVMEWHSRGELWHHAGLESPGQIPVCAYEPAGQRHVGPVDYPKGAAGTAAVA